MVDRSDEIDTVIVGGVAAGASTGARLRRLDEPAEIVVLERGEYVSFANCGLPYHIDGEILTGGLLLQTPESLAKSLALDVRTGQDVTRIDRDAKEVEVRDVRSGRTYRESYDKLVLCPGAQPIQPPIRGADDPRVDVLRDIADRDRIVARFEKGVSFRSYIAYCALKQNGFKDVAFLSGGTMTYHGFHRTPLAVGKGGMPVVEYAGDTLAQRPGALARV